MILSEKPVELRSSRFRQPFSDEIPIRAIEVNLNPSGRTTHDQLRDEPHELA
jgi:hypothetical protein